MSHKNLTMEDLFDLIHRRQAERLLEILESDDVSPPMFNAINKFLADNNISGVKGENTALNKLSDGLAAYEANSDNVVQFKQ